MKIEDKNIQSKPTWKRVVYLFISLFMNVTLLSLLIYFWSHRQSVAIIVEPATSGLIKEKNSIPGYFSAYLTSNSIQEYIQKKTLLTEQELIELFVSPTEEISCGITNKDILASLLFKKGVTIDVPLKSIGKWPQKVVEMPYIASPENRGKQESILCFTALSAGDEERIKEYLLVEKMPYTAEKLFTLIQDPHSCTQNAIESFQKTQEWVELKRALYPLFKDDTKLFLYLRIFSWIGVNDHLNLVREHINTMVITEEQKSAKSLTLHDLLPLIAQDFIRTKSPQLAQVFIAICPPKEILRTTSSSFISVLFEALPSQPTQEVIALSIEIAKSVSKEELFEIAKKKIATSIKSPELMQLTRSQFIQKFSQLLTLPTKELERAFSQNIQEIEKRIDQKSLSQQNPSSKKASDSKLPPVTIHIAQDKAKNESCNHESIKEKDVLVHAIVKTAIPSTTTKYVENSSSAHSYASSIASQNAKEAISPYIFYTVRKGDTLWSLSKRFGVSVDKIRYLNKIKGNTIPPGIVLKIPKAHSSDRSG